jgi:hypothetical protein
MVAPSGHHSYGSGQDYSSYDKIQLLILFISIPVASFQHSLDTLVRILVVVGLIICSMFTERLLISHKLNVSYTSAVKELCVIIVMKIVWMGQMILTHFVRFPDVNAHYLDHLAQPFEYRVACSQNVDSCHQRVPETLH